MNKMHDTLKSISEYVCTQHALILKHSHRPIDVIESARINAIIVNPVLSYRAELGLTTFQSQALHNWFDYDLNHYPNKAKGMQLFKSLLSDLLSGRREALPLWPHDPNSRRVSFTVAATATVHAFPSVRKHVSECSIAASALMSAPQ